MQTTWITKGDSKKLRIVMLGWAADPGMAHATEGCDTVCMYDYREMPCRSEVQSMMQAWAGEYEEICLIAWSYGVWAAEQIFGGQGFASATAINGTPYPTDVKFGISPRAFALTIAGIEKVGTDTFARRMCHGMELPLELKRPTAECVEELKTFAEKFKQEYTPRIKWSKAIIGTSDLIFPPDSQRSYWETLLAEGEKIIIEIIEGMPHYPVGKL